VNLSFVFAVAALVCAVLLLVQIKNRLWALVAAVVAAVELLIALNVIRLSVAGVPLAMVLGVALAIAGVVVWMQVQGKTHVSAATIIALVGAVQTLSQFRGS
jgi:hypothetical protein